MKKHYDGQLGKFVYDTKEFEIKKQFNNKDILRYIGTETDGKKIKIPNGIIDASYMFEGNSTLTSLPVIPDGVTYAHSMFEECTSIKTIDIQFPSSLVDICQMFYGCTSLESIPETFPAQIRNYSDAFYFCNSLTKVKVKIQRPNDANAFPVRLTSMFSNCDNLEQVDLDISQCNKAHIMLMFSCCERLKKVNIKWPKLVENATSMFQECVNLTKFDDIPCPIIVAENMFNATAIERINFKLPLMRKMNGMFCACSNLTEVDITLPHTGYSFNNMFSQCIRLKKARIRLQEGATVAEDSFHNFLKGCDDLQEVDIILPSIVTLTPSILPDIPNKIIQNTSRFYVKKSCKQDISNLFNGLMKQIVHLEYFNSKFGSFGYLEDLFHFKFVLKNSK